MNKKETSRRSFIRNTALSATGVVMFGPSVLKGNSNSIASDSGLKISVAEWSWNKQLFGGKMKNTDFAAKAKSFDINAIEYVSQFF